MPFIDDFDRNRDLLFHLFGGAARPLRDHLDVIVGDVGIRLHRQIVERNRAPDEQQDGQRRHQKPVVEGEIDESAEASGNSIYSRGRILQDQRVADHCLARALDRDEDFLQVGPAASSRRPLRRGGSCFRPKARTPSRDRAGGGRADAGTTAWDSLVVAVERRGHEHAEAAGFRDSAISSRTLAVRMVGIENRARCW